MRCSRALTEVISRLTASSPTLASRTSAYFASGSPWWRSGSTASCVMNACARSLGAASRDQREHRAVDGHGEGVRAERVELGPAQGGPLDRELERLAFHPDGRIA